jgi:hypothetical protein
MNSDGNRPEGFTRKEEEEEEEEEEESRIAHYNKDSYIYLIKNCTLLLLWLYSPLLGLDRFSIS